jgi:hypothetical protein
VDYLHDAHEQGKRILIEGANATMLDVDHGTYPFVTSSNPSIGGIVTGLGMAPTKFEAIIGVVSCYSDVLHCYVMLVTVFLCHQQQPFNRRHRDRPGHGTNQV